MSEEDQTVTKEDLDGWRQDTRLLTSEVSKLTEAFKAMASREDVKLAVSEARRITLNRVYVVVGIVALTLVGLGAGLLIAGVTYKNQRDAFSQQVYEACVLRNRSDIQRNAQGTATFQVLIKRLPPDVSKVLQDVYKSQEPAPLPDCSSLKP